jgi:hypothetical protein
MALTSIGLVGSHYLLHLKRISIILAAGLWVDHRMKT